MSYKIYNNNEIVKGYKSFILDQDNLCDGYGNKYEIGTVYHQAGEISYGKNGYHFCLNPVDTLSYSNVDNELVVCEVEGFGNMYSVDNEYRDIYDIHICESFKILRAISKEELKDIIKKSGYRSIEKYIKYQSNCVLEEELEYLIDNLNKQDKERLLELYELFKNNDHENHIQRIRK